MRSLFFLLIFVSLTSIAFCTPKVDYIPVSSVSTARFGIKLPVPIENRSPGILNDRTTRLEVRHCAFSSHSGDLEVQFSGLDDPTQIRLKGRQELQFKNPGGQLISVILPVRAYLVIGQTLQVNFVMGGSTNSQLELLTSQSIVIEDIVVN